MLLPCFKAYDIRGTYPETLNENITPGIDCSNKKITVRRRSHGIEHRHRRPSQRGQVHPFQRADQGTERAGRELPLLHHRAQQGHGSRARPPHRRARRSGAPAKND